MALAATLALALGLTFFAAPAAQAQTYSVIYNFQYGPFGGITPWAGVTIKGNALYGTERRWRRLR